MPQLIGTYTNIYDWPFFILIEITAKFMINKLNQGLSTTLLLDRLETLCVYVNLMDCDDKSINLFLNWLEQKGFKNDNLKILTSGMQIVRPIKYNFFRNCVVRM